MDLVPVHPSITLFLSGGSQRPHCLVLSIGCYLAQSDSATWSPCGRTEAEAKTQAKCKKNNGKASECGSQSSKDCGQVFCFADWRHGRRKSQSDGAEESINLGPRRKRRRKPRPRRPRQRLVIIRERGGRGGKDFVSLLMIFPAIPGAAPRSAGAAPAPGKQAACLWWSRVFGGRTNAILEGTVWEIWPELQ